MTDHEAGVIPVPTMTGAFIKRPGMYMGSPIRFDRAVTFISGYTFAVLGIRGALSSTFGTGFRAPNVEGGFIEQLREEGRLRWNRWDLTVAAEAIRWTSDDAPVIDDFTEEQHRAAIEALAPLLDRVFGLPQEIADDLAKDMLPPRSEDG